jgi:hypothetical protein
MTRSLQEHFDPLREGKGQPLLTEEEILETLRSRPLPPETDTLEPRFLQRHGRTMAWTAAAAAATIVGFLVVPTFMRDEAIPVSKDQVDQVQAMDHTVVDADDQAPLTTTDVQKLARSSTASNANGLDVKMMELAPTELAKLHLSVTESSITYTEDGFTVTIKTSGIGVRGSQTLGAGSTTPRQVTIYRGGRVMATWADTTRPNIKVNDLVPVTIRLEDASNAMFPHADVVLWFEPTPAFVHALPTTERVAIEKELTSNDPTSLYIERQTSTASIASSKVFPNPVSGTSATLQLNVVRSCTATVDIVDINGRSVLTLFTNEPLMPGSTSSILQPLTSLPNGMYLVVVDVDNGRERLVQRLLIER